MFKIILGIIVFITGLYANEIIKEQEFNISSIKYWNFNNIKDIRGNSNTIKKWITNNGISEFIILDNIKKDKTIFSIKGFFKEKCIKKDDTFNLCLLSSPSIGNSINIKYYKNAMLNTFFEIQPIFLKINKEKGLLSLTISNSKEFSYIEKLITYFAKISKLNERDIVVIVDMKYKPLKTENNIFENLNLPNYINEELIITNQQKVIINDGSYNVNNIHFTINKGKTIKEQVKLYRKDFSDYLPLEFTFKQKDK